MAIDPPYRLDPFQNIVNVGWDITTGEGLGNVAVFIWQPGTFEPPGYILNGWALGWNGEYLSTAFSSYVAALNADGYGDFSPIAESVSTGLMVDTVPGLGYSLLFIGLDQAVAAALDPHNEAASLADGETRCFLNRWNQVVAQSPSRKAYVIAQYDVSTATA